MFGRAYGDEVAARHFYQDVFPVAEFQAGERILALLCHRERWIQRGRRRTVQHLLLEGGVQGDIVECRETCVSL